jgi:hypothetical protein
MSVVVSQIRRQHQAPYRSNHRIGGIETRDPLKNWQWNNNVDAVGIQPFIPTDIG